MDTATTVFGTYPLIGWVVTNWSSWYPQAFLAKNAAIED